MTAVSYKSATPRHSAADRTTIFQKRSRSLIPQAQRDAQANHEKLKKSIPHECKVICFCTKHELQAAVDGLDAQVNPGASGAFLNRPVIQSRNANNSSVLSSSMPHGVPGTQFIPEESSQAATFFNNPDQMMCDHSQTTNVNTVYEIVSAQV